VPETGVSAVSLLTTFMGGLNKSGMERRNPTMDAGLLQTEMETEGLSGEMGSLEAFGRTGVTAVVLALSLRLDFSVGHLRLEVVFWEVLPGCRLLDLRGMYSKERTASLSIRGQELSAYATSLPGCLL
jgi:hypothetical protein